MIFDISELKETATGKYVLTVVLGANEVLSMIAVVEAAENVERVYGENGALEAEAIEELREMLKPFTGFS